MCCFRNKSLPLHFIAQSHASLNLCGFSRLYFLSLALRFSQNSAMSHTHQGRSQDFSKTGSHCVSNRGYLPDCHVDLHAVFYLMQRKKKGLPRLSPCTQSKRRLGFPAFPRKLRSSIYSLAPPPSPPSPQPLPTCHQIYIKADNFQKVFVGVY